MSDANRVALRFNEEAVFSVSPTGEVLAESTDTTQATRTYAAVAGTPFSIFSVGQTIIISGFSNSGSNGYKTIESIGGSGANFVVKETIGADEVAVSGSYSTAYNELRYTGESFRQETDTVESNEIRADRQVPFVARTNLRGLGDLNLELSYAAYDDFLAASLMSAGWSDIVESVGDTFGAAASDNAYYDTKTGVALLTGAGATCTCLATDDSYNDATEDFSAIGLVVGQKILISGSTEATNNGVKTVVSVTANKLVVAEALVAEAVAFTIVITSVGFAIAGLLPHQWIEVRGFTEVANNGYSKVVSVSDPSGTPYSASTVEVVTNDRYKDVVVDLSGFVAGQRILVAGFTEAANNGIKVIVSASANELVVAEVLVTEPLGDAVTIDNVSSMVVEATTLVDEVIGDTVTATMASQIVNGVAFRSFTMEREYSDRSNEFARFPGSMIDTLNLEITAEQIITGSFGFIGKNGASATASLSDGVPQDAPTKDVMTAVDDVLALLENNTEQDATTLSFQVQNKLRQRTNIGVLGAVSVGAGRIGCSGTVQMYFEDKSIMDKYLNYETSRLAVMTEDADGNVYIVEFPRMKYTSGQAVAGGTDTDVIADMAFSAYRNPDEDVTVRITRFAA